MALRSAGFSDLLNAHPEIHELAVDVKDYLPISSGSRQTAFGLISLMSSFGKISFP